MQPQYNPNTRKNLYKSRENSKPCNYCLFSSHDPYLDRGKWISLLELQVLVQVEKSVVKNECHFAVF